MNHKTLVELRAQYGLPPAPEDPDAYWVEALAPGSGELRLLFDFHEEPDLDMAYGGFVREVETSRERNNPSWLPPDGFMAESPPEVRYSHWRGQERFPALTQAREWLFAITDRVFQDVPPVSLAEFDQLAGWFRTNKAKAFHWCQRHKDQLGFIPLGDVEQAIRRGGRSQSAGQAAQLIRNLRNAMEKIS